MSQPTVIEPKAPLNWTPTLCFAHVSGGLRAGSVVGLTHGFARGAWGFFVFFLLANGLAITGGYHRLWAHRTYDAHWTLRLFYMVFGAMSLQNSRSTGAAVTAPIIFM